MASREPSNSRDKFTSFSPLSGSSPESGPYPGEGTSRSHSQPVAASSSSSWTKRMISWVTSSTSTTPETEEKAKDEGQEEGEGEGDDEKGPKPLPTIAVTKASTSSSADGLTPRPGIKDVIKRLKSRFSKKGGEGVGSDAEMKRYWMPDSNARVCYDCGEKFTALRRRHHCRICGQIFCSKCCSEEIEGRLISSSLKSSLRSCSYCYNTVTKFLTADGTSSTGKGKRGESLSSPRRESHDQMATDLNALREQLFTSLSEVDEGQRGFSGESEGTYSPYSTVTSISSLTRRSSIGFREEELAKYSQSCRLREAKSSLTNSDSPYKISMRGSSAPMTTSAGGFRELSKDRTPKKTPTIVEFQVSQDQEQGLHEPFWVKEINPLEDSVEGKPSVIDSSSLEIVDLPDEKRNQDAIDADMEGDPTRSRRDTLVSSSSTFDIELDLNQDRVSVSKPVKVIDDDSIRLTPSLKCSRRASTITEDVANIGELSAVDEVIPMSIDSKVTHWESEGYIEKKVLSTLNGEYEVIYTEMLTQLLNDDNLVHSWLKVIKDISGIIGNTVRPTHKKENEEIDVRQYVKIKQIPGGNKVDSQIISGVVFTKNVTHRKMKQSIKNPKILLLSCPIAYQQRLELKMTSLDAILLQENNYLRNLVAKISSYKPDVVIIDKTVSRTAQVMLLDLGITLVCNVKTTILERLGLFTGAAIVSSLDAQIGSPTLGSCLHFYLQTFNGTKTLMFFDGCSPEIGCTVILRGTISECELKKIKEICSFMIYCEYNWRLERSFLMDIFAMPLKDVTVNEEEEEEEEEEKVKGVCLELEDVEKLVSVIGEEYEEEAEEGRIHSIVIDDDSDPLRMMAAKEERNVSNMSATSPLFSKSIIEPTPKCKPSTLGQIMKQLLSQLVLLNSPFIELKLPYLLEEGENCPVKKYIPCDSMYWSKRFKLIEKSELTKTRLRVDECTVTVKTEVCPSDVMPTNNKHPFFLRDLKYPINGSNGIQALIADFRARGGMLPFKSQPRPTKVEKDAGRSLNKSSSQDTIVDALHPKYHQRFPVLYCNYTYSSSTSPFCVSPTILDMEFYGANDIALGAYLEEFCFRPNYKCVNQRCSTSVVEHIRKFCHSTGSVRITLKQLKVSVAEAQADIITWSWCQKCKTSSPFVVLNDESWSMSFASFLRLKVCGDKYVRRPGGDSPSCTLHSLFHDHFQYFAHKQLVASFKYFPIVVCEVVHPSSTIRMRVDAIGLNDLREELKFITIKGYDVLSSVLEKLCSLKSETANTVYELIIRDFMSSESNDRALFRKKIEEMQTELTLHPDVYRRISISFKLILLMKMIAETVQTWNQRIQEFIANKRKDEKDKRQPFASQSTLSNLSRQTSNADFDQISLSGSTAVVSRQHSQIDSEREFQSFDDKEFAKNIKRSSSVLSQLAPIVQASDDAEEGAEKSPHKSPEKPRHKIVRGNSVLQDQHEECTHVLESLNQAPLEDSLEDRSEPNLILEESSSSSSVSSVCYGDSPGISAGLGKEAIFSGDNESFAVYHHHHHYSSTTSKTPEDEAEKHVVLRKHPEALSVSAINFQQQEGNRSLSSNINRSQQRVEPVKQSMKTIINQLLSNSNNFEIEAPFSISDHFLLPSKESQPVIIRDEDPGSLIAYSLSSLEYEKQMELIWLSASPMVSKKKMVASTDSVGSSVSCSEGKDPTFMPDIAADVTSGNKAFVSTSGSGAAAFSKTSSQGPSTGPSPHVDLQFFDSTTKFYCCLYFAESFRKMRSNVLEIENPTPSPSALSATSGSEQTSGPISGKVYSCEEMFVRCVSHCKPWIARGGKSGSLFWKTSDERFILKEMSRPELQSFLNIAKFYFEYIERAINECRPTLLAKIVGVYKTSYKNSVTGSASKMYLLVMENLFFNRTIAQKFDLKGSVRNRLASMSSPDDVVLLDENLIKVIRDAPFYIPTHSKAVLRTAIDNDSHFLSSYEVMDYSLLVGMDEERKQLVVGIIDFIRPFTWDKKMEMLFKSLPSVGSQHRNRMPTIVSPFVYRERFCEKMDQYFLSVPDAWHRLDVRRSDY